MVAIEGYAVARSFQITVGVTSQSDSNGGRDNLDPC